MATQTTTVEGVSNAYKQKEEVWFDDGREEKLVQYVRERLPATQASRPQDVIDLIDEYGRKQSYMMNVGTEKGGIVAGLIAEHRPKTMIELGGYVGYSTILFAAALRDNGGSEYISFEREPKFARVASELVRLAGLSDIVRVVVGPSSRNLVAEHAAGRLSAVDMVFLDHYKPAYVKDLKICESLGIIRVGTVLAADNVIEPGNPTYLEYVRSSPQEKQTRLSAVTESTAGANFPSRTVNQYKEYELDDTELPGVPGIVYESRLVNSFEPTGVPDGVEITICREVPS